MFSSNLQLLYPMRDEFFLEIMEVGFRFVIKRSGFFDQICVYIFLCSLKSANIDMGETKETEAYEEELLDYEEEDEKAPDSVAAKVNGESVKKSVFLVYLISYLVLSIDL